MKVVLVCIAKNEDKYIQEWIDYNFKLGFDKIFIYQNDWRWSGENENVIKIEFDGINKQRDAYRHFIQNNYSKYEWVAFFDVDEFLVLKKHKNIKEFISEYSQYDGIGINWVLFGDNGLDKTESDTSLIRRFIKRQKIVNRQVKSILKLHKNLKMDIHNPINQRLVDTNKNLFIGPFNKFGNDDIAQLNHYFCKTKEEFVEKINKGRADTPYKIHNRTMIDFDSHNYNEIEDLTAYNFFYDNNNLLNT